MNINNDENETMVGMEKNGAKLQKQFGPQNFFGSIQQVCFLQNIVGYNCMRTKVHKGL